MHRRNKRPPCRKIVLKLPDLDHAKSAVLHTKAEYICADLSIHSSLFPCSQTADHTFWGITSLSWSPSAGLFPSNRLDARTSQGMSGAFQ